MFWYIFFNFLCIVSLSFFTCCAQVIECRHNILLYSIYIVSHFWDFSGYHCFAFDTKGQLVSRQPACSKRAGESIAPWRVPASTCLHRCCSRPHLPHPAPNVLECLAALIVEPSSTCQKSSTIAARFLTQITASRLVFYSIRHCFTRSLTDGCVDGQGGDDVTGCQWLAHSVAAHVRSLCCVGPLYKYLYAARKQSFATNKTNARVACKACNTSTWHNTGPNRC